MSTGSRVGPEDRLGAASIKHSRDDAVEEYQRLANYFSAAMDIRNGLEFNKADCEHFVQQHGIIRYIFDSNVLLFFLNPAREKGAVDPFATRDDQLNTALALVTAEYLFSGDLPGQFNAPPLMSQWHWEEVTRAVKNLDVDKANRESDRSHFNADRDAKSWELGRDVAEIVRYVQTERNLGDSIAQLTSIEPRIRGLVADEIYAITMFERLKRTNQVDPISFDENAVGAVLNLNRDRVDRWQERISTHRDAAGREDEPHSKNDRRDANTIEQIVQLNLNARDGYGPPTRYVFITHDRSLYNAGVSWWDAAPELDFFPFRRLSQYIPNLNTDVMPNSTEDTGLAEQLLQVLNTLLNLGPRSRRRLPLYVPAPNVKPPAKSLASELNQVNQWIIDNTEYKRVHHRSIQLWRDISASSILLNAELLRRRLRAFTPLADFIEKSSDVRRGVVDFMRERIDAFETAHLELNMLHHLANQILAGDVRDSNVRAVRGILVLHEDFAEVVGEPDRLYKFLEELVREADADQIRKVAASISQLRAYKCHLLAGCITFWAGQWEQAAHHSSRALATARTPHIEVSPRLWADLTYFRVIALRYLALDIKDDLRQIESELIGLSQAVDEMVAAAQEADCAFARVRANVESALRYACLAFVTVSSAPERSNDAHEAARTAYAILHAIEGEARMVWDNQPPARSTLMRIELFTGVVGCLIIQAMHGDGELTGDRLQRWAHLRDDLADALGQHKSLVPSFYEISLNFLDLILCKDLREIDEKRNVLDYQLHQILSGDQHMTWFDRHVLRNLLDKLDYIAPHGAIGAA